MTDIDANLFLLYCVILNLFVFSVVVIYLAFETGYFWMEMSTYYINYELSVTE